MSKQITFYCRLSIKSTNINVYTNKFYGGCLGSIVILAHGNVSYRSKVILAHGNVRYCSKVVRVSLCAAIEKECRVIKDYYWRSPVKKLFETEVCLSVPSGWSLRGLVKRHLDLQL